MPRRGTRMRGRRGMRRRMGTPRRRRLCSRYIWTFCDGMGPRKGREVHGRPAEGYHGAGGTVKEGKVQADHVIEALIEIPVGSRNKYEYDEKRQRIRLDRVLYASVHYPTHYGLIPGTLASDGDPLDVLVLAEEPVFPGCLVDARVLGALHMRDMGQDDHKIVAVEHSDPRLSPVNELRDVAPHLLKEIETFFNTYKD